jgi:hypothetical protein
MSAGSYKENGGDGVSVVNAWCAGGKGQQTGNVHEKSMNEGDKQWH